MYKIGNRVLMGIGRHGLGDVKKRRWLHPFSGEAKTLSNFRIINLYEISEDESQIKSKDGNSKGIMGKKKTG